MKKWIFAICACALATGAWCADTKVATRNWVIKQLVSQGLRTNTATVTDNGDGTITVRSSFEYAGVTNCVAIYFTVVKPSDPFDDSIVYVRPSLLSLIFPSAYADEVGAEIGDDGSVTITLSQGGWVDNVGNLHEFNFFTNGPWTLTLQDGTLNEIPSSEHLCELDADCNCAWADYSEEDVEIPEEYQDVTAAKMREYGWLDISHWVDLANWPANLTETVGKGKKQRTVYYVRDDNGINFDIQAISETDAWAEALAQALTAINKHQEKCRDAYIQSKICDKENPQHDWQTKQCGGNSWRICSRNSTHGDNPNHTGHTIQGRCSCGEMPSPHSIVTGDRAAKEGNTGWTQTTYCSLGCGLSQTVDHDCTHEKCKSCSAGDDCDWPCPTCNGRHNFGGQTEGRCVRCLCDNCGITEREQTGALVVINVAHHSGWQACTEHADPEQNAKGGGLHCCCECGNYGCPGGSSGVGNTHLREAIDPPQYEQIDDNNLKHYVITYTECERCHDPFGLLEDHTWSENVYHEWLSNEKCAEKKVCENCGFEDVENEEDAGGHSPDGDPFKFEDGGEGVCKFWYTCELCGETYYDESHDHDYSGAEVERYEEDGDVCVQVKKCVREGCGHEYRDESHAHVRDESTCKCQNCKTYQFEHSYVQDACGNESCEYCHQVKPGTEEQHSWGNGEHDEGGHFCNCGSKYEGHRWAAATVKRMSQNTVTYEHVCTVCGRSEEWTVDGSAGCRGEIHVPKLNNCGCVCGFYSATNETATTAMFHYTEDPTENCLCSCGKWHSYTAPTAYNLNVEERTESARCDGICKVCKSHTATGLEKDVRATVEDHTPATHKCGCRCGEITGSMTELPKFHPRMANSCRCCGDDGNGGKYHYRRPNGACPKICAYGGIDSPLGHHLAALAEIEVGRNPATANDHTRTGSAACGCACGDYTNSNTPASAGNLHNQNLLDCGCYCKQSPTEHRYVAGKSIGCFCACDAQLANGGHITEEGHCYCKCRGTAHDDVKKHTRVQRQDGKCPGVCHGECEEFKDESKKKQHSISETECGCECRQFTGTDYPDRTADRGWHVRRTTGDTCKCNCDLNLHIFTEPRRDCYTICSLCGDHKTYLAGKDPQKAGTRDDHVFEDACVCACGKYTRDHDWGPWTASGEQTSYECQVCGRTIEVQPEQRSCQRNCDATETRDRELSAHDFEAHGGYSGGTESGVCPVHFISFVDGYCPVDGCRYAREDDGHTSGGAGGQTSGTGTDEDV